MINLIPPEGHKMIRREYFLRVGSTILFLFSSVIVCLTIALVPRYVLIDAQIKTTEAGSNQEGINNDVYVAVEKEVSDVNSVLSQFKMVSAPILSSTVIEQIRSTAPTSIIFETFVVNSTGDHIDAVQISGVAPTREALAELKSDLEASSMFEKAEVPIADLVRDNNLPFTITVTLEKNN